MKAIVYTSNSGFTKRYAELLSSETGLPAYDLKRDGGRLARNSEIIYLGWLMAGKVKGYRKAARKFAVKAVCAVGMARPEDIRLSELKSKNNTADTPVFYLWGGFDLNKLRGIYKFMMKSMGSIVMKKLENKPDKTESEIEALNLFKNGGDRVQAENLSDVLAWYRG